MLKTRPNELTAVLKRELFDRPPGDLKTNSELSRWTKFRMDYHDAQSLRSVSEFPLQIDFELKYNCNFGCHFCPHGNPSSPQPKRNTSLTFEQFARVIDEGEKNGLCSIKLNYINEPLLVPDLTRYIDYAKAHGVLNVYFATNGTLLSEIVARALIESRVSKIMISLDAATPETFLDMRRSDKYHLIIANILRLLRIRNEMNLTYPLVRVNFVKTPVNSHELDEFVNQWRDVADMIGVEEQVGLPGIENDEVIQHDLSNFRCSFPFKLVVIDSNGDILPCCTFSGRQMPIGNIENTTVKKAWHSLKMRKLREIHLNGVGLQNKVCRHCLGVK